MTRPPNVRAVLFDAAGTLIELREPVGETYARVAREFGVDLPAWRLSDAFARVIAASPDLAFPGAPESEIDARERGWWREVVRSTFRAADGTARFPDFDGFFDALYLRYSDPATWRARPGAAEALDQLRERGLATGVVSNFDGRLPGHLAALDLAARLDAVVLPRDVGAAKPDPRIFAEALSRLGVPASAAVYVGDDPERDLASANAAGLAAIDVTTLATLSELPARLESPLPEKPA